MRTDSRATIAELRFCEFRVECNDGIWFENLKCQQYFRRSVIGDFWNNINDEKRKFPE